MRGQAEGSQIGPRTYHPTGNMNWVHLHLALNHIPVLGTLFVGLLLVTAIIKRNPELVRLSLTWFVTLTLVSIPIKFTGDFAHQATIDSEWLRSEMVANHEQAADQATGAIFLLGLFAAYGRFQGRAKRPIPIWLTAVITILTLATFALMARTANLGGQLRHEEIRPRTHRVGSGKSAASVTQQKKTSSSTLQCNETSDLTRQERGALVRRWSSSTAAALPGNLALSAGDTPPGTVACPVRS